MKLADPENPLNQSCQTNLIPKSDTDSDSGAGLPSSDSAHPDSDPDLPNASAGQVYANSTPSDEQDPSADPEERDESQEEDPDFADGPPMPRPASLVHYTFIAERRHELPPSATTASAGGSPARGRLKFEKRGQSFRG